MPLTDALRDDILASVPSLRAFAISLSGNGDRADDLVQETLLRALANIDSFQPGSNLPAWLFTILRNLFRSDYRKRRREVEDAEGNYAKTLKTQPSQSAHLEFEEFRAALDKLPQDQREALILVGASGFSYEDAAAICGCAVGTIKSRVNRARSKLAALLYVDGAEDFGPDETVRAVIGGNGVAAVTARMRSECRSCRGLSRSEQSNGLGHASDAPCMTATTARRRTGAEICSVRSRSVMSTTVSIGAVSS